MALHVMEEANRCLGCKKPRCREDCPVTRGTVLCVDDGYLL